MNTIFKMKIKVVDNPENLLKFDKYVESETIKYWESIYDTIYSIEDCQTVGWIDSRTGIEYSKDTLEYLSSSFVENVVCRKESPCMLEIGVGTGLIFDKVKRKFPKGEFWITDISNKALESKDATMKLLQKATNFDNIPMNKFDVIVINSVVQYFPSCGVLKDVIGMCQNALLDSESYILMGDIRNLKTISKQENVNRELLIHPDFFGKDCKYVTYPNKYNSEMELYRYTMKIPKGDSIENWEGAVKENVNWNCNNDSKDYILFKSLSDGSIVNGYIDPPIFEYQYRCNDIGKLNLPIIKMHFAIESLEMECCANSSGVIVETDRDYIVSSVNNVYDLITKRDLNTIAIVDRDSTKHCYKKILNDVDSLQLPSTTIIIFMKKSYEYIVAILYCLKNKIPFLPLDPKIPRKRLDDILLNFKDFVVLTSLNQYFTAEELNTKSLYDDSVCYYVFTSGSTAKPKLIPLRHEGLTNFVLEHQRIVGISDSDTILHFFNVAFDASLWVILSTLCWGAKLVLWNENQDLNKIIQQEDVNVMFMLPSFVEALDPESVQQITKLAVAGESVSTEVFDSGVEEIYNVYGPSEVTIASHVTLMNREEGVNVGKGLNNVKWKLNGETDEIMISGIGVTPLEKNEYYCTGDKGHVTSDGNLVVDGRLDRQIKLNGFRINLDEIGKHISGHALINDNKLYGFVDSEPTQKKEYLESVLPKYMIPTEWLVVEEFPRTENGKINIKKLKESIFTPIKEFKAEGKIVDIIQEYISLPKNELETTHLFDTGIQSIQIYKLLNQISREMNVRVDSNFLFTNPKIIDFISEVNKSAENSTKICEERCKKTKNTFQEYLSYSFYVLNVLLSLIFYFRGVCKIKQDNVKIITNKLEDSIENVVFSIHPHGPTGEHIWEIFEYIKSNISKTTKMFLFPLLCYSYYYKFLGGISDKTNYKDVKDPLLVTPGYISEIYSTADNPCGISTQYHFFEQVMSSKKDIIPVYMFNVNNKYKRLGNGIKCLFMQPFVWKDKSYDDVKVIFGRKIRSKNYSKIEDLRKDYIIAINQLARLEKTNISFEY